MNYFFKIVSEDAIELINKLQKCKYISKKSFEDIYNEVNAIHICNTKYEWQPLFTKSRYYSTFQELVKFYDNNQKDVKIIQENGVEIYWLKLMSEIYSSRFFCTKNYKNEICCGENKYVYYTDEDGFYWSRVRRY